jgi:ribonuclease T
MNELDKTHLSSDEVYVSVDIETAGPIPAAYSMLSLGACTINDPDDGFYAELRPITAEVVPEALQVSGLSMDELAITGHEPAVTMQAFAEWIDRVAAGMLPVFVGFNASFDWAFVNWYFHTYLGANPFGIGALDIKAYYMGRFGTRWAQTTSSHIPARFQSQRPHTHNALDDARAQADMFRKLLDRATV